MVRMKPLVQGQKGWTKAIIARRLDERSYMVESPEGAYRRNRAYLRKTPEDPPVIPRQHKETMNKAKRTANQTMNNTMTRQEPRQDPLPRKSLAAAAQQQPAPQPKTTSIMQEPRPKKATAHPEPRPQTTSPSQQQEPEQEPAKPPDRVTKSGREVRRPSYLKDYDV